MKHLLTIILVCLAMSAGAQVHRDGIGMYKEIYPRSISWLAGGVSAERLYVNITELKVDDSGGHATARYWLMYPVNDSVWSPVGGQTAEGSVTASISDASVPLIMGIEGLFAEIKDLPGLNISYK